MGIEFFYRLQEQGNGQVIDTGRIVTDWRDDCPEGYIKTFPGGGSCYNYNNSFGWDQRWDDTTYSVDLLSTIPGTGCYDLVFWTKTYIQNGGILTDSAYTTSFCYTTNFFPCLFPVELSYFEATMSDSQVSLAWETASESNSDYFLVERSIDGLNFKGISSFIPAAGFSEAQLRYLFIDQSPLVGTNYYRLKMVDQDGTIEYSDIQAVRNSTPSTTLPDKLVTNGNWNFHFNALSSEIAKLNLYNNLGQLIFQRDLELSAGQPFYNFDVHHLPKGLYVASLDIKNDPRRYTAKISIMK